ncbi:HD domain-containing protein [Candidatus Woesearchaeota archaeon]|nr:HD domain-containing protein [Candidatus Woesearchaeota archaeon]
METILYDRKLGQSLMQKYLNTDKLQKRLEHTQGVAELAYKVADKIKKENPELIDFDPEFVGFLGYVHDIGYSVADGKHEVHTINILVEKENVSKDIARLAMHGQLAEQFGEKEGNVAQYLPVGLEGMILTYADMSVRTGEPVPMRERAKEIIERIKAIPTMSAELKKDIEDNMYKALPRFEQYERTILSLAKVSSIRGFLK